MIGFVIGFGLAIIMAFTLNELKKLQNGAPKFLIGACHVLQLGALVLPFWLVPRLMPHQTITLHKDGVTFSALHHRVNCPWSLFCTNGTADPGPEERILINVNVDSIPKVELVKGGGRKIGSGWSSDTWFFLMNRDHAVYFDRYIPGIEIGRLLIELAWKIEWGRA